MSKFSLWLTYSTCRNAKRKPRQQKNQCVSTTQHVITLARTGTDSSSSWAVIAIDHTNHGIRSSFIIFILMLSHFRLTRRNIICKFEQIIYCLRFEWWKWRAISVVWKKSAIDIEGRSFSNIDSCYWSTQNHAEHGEVVLKLLEILRFSGSWLWSLLPYGMWTLQSSIYIYIYIYIYILMLHEPTASSSRP